MPKWQIHDKWARKTGISEEVSNFVNRLIDFPQECQEFLDFCDREPDARIYIKGRPTRMSIGSFARHDSARTKERDRNIQLKFLWQKGEEYIKAFYLHHILDYLEWWVKNMPSDSTPNIHDILQEKRLAKKIGLPQDEQLQKMVIFAVNHSEEILRDFQD